MHLPCHSCAHSGMDRWQTCPGIISRRVALVDMTMVMKRQNRQTHNGKTLETCLTIRHVMHSSANAPRWHDRKKGRHAAKSRQRNMMCMTFANSWGSL